MSILSATFKSLGSIISVYSTICFVRIILTWFPTMRGSQFEYFLSRLCDPYLNMFSKIKWMHIGLLDFSPILAFSFLSALSNIFMQISLSGKISLAYILIILLRFSWSIISSILFLLLIMMIIRFIMILSNKQGSMFWNSVDRLIFKLSNPIVKIFVKNRYVKPIVYSSIALIEFALIYVLGNIAIRFLVSLIYKIPF